jgi:hypothetical protein
MQRDIRVGTVSWINATPNPIWFSGKAKLLDPAWVCKTYIGLMATANSPPPQAIADFAEQQRGKEYRALMSFTVRLTTDDRSGAVTACDLLQSVIDPGWTPPFRIFRYPSIATLGWIDGWDSFKQVWGTSYYAGESSPLSSCKIQGRHRNSTIDSVPNAETVLLNALIKFRAGEHTDQVGIKTAEAPFHVPWVWCETLLTYGNGRVKVYGRGSVFPSHAWYLDGKQVTTNAQIADTSFPSKQVEILAPPPSIPWFGPRLTVPDVLTIDVEALRIYPVLRRGAAASGPQVPRDADAAFGGSVEQHPYTVSGCSILTSP